MINVKLFLIICFLFGSFTVAAVDKPENTSNKFVWVESQDGEATKLHLYFFWSKKCPHCLVAQPFVERLPQEFSWLVLHSHELSEHPENVEKYASIAKKMNVTRISVPAFVFCGNMVFGFDSESTTGEYLKENLKGCYQFSKNQNSEKPAVSRSQQEPPLSLPIIGEVTPGNYSLPVFTLLIALMDSFNPCAFFVLLFLLSLLTHTRSRNRMLLIGGVFVFFSGFIYFLFMTAWLNMFMLFGSMQYVTLGAGLIAAAIALVNIKEYFLFKKGLSLSIPESAKPKLIQRMRALVNTDNISTMLLGTVVLSILANTYELLCTAGFPMVYTRYLTLLELNPMEYYAYLVFYNLVYILPLSIIVIAFTFFLGSRKLSEKEGKVLKLVSGLMMLGLGLLLIFNPNALNNIATAIILILSSIVITWLVTRVSNL